jgi:hypothetical protein
MASHDLRPCRPPLPPGLVLEPGDTAAMITVLVVSEPADPGVVRNKRDCAADAARLL